jgi:excisionase family DNA binding protein
MGAEPTELAAASSLRSHDDPAIEFGTEKQSWLWDGGRAEGFERRRRSDPYIASIPEAAALLGISKDLAYDLARRGELPGAFQLGRRWCVSLVKLRTAVHGAQDRTPEDAR